MKNTVLKYGTISGLLMAVFMFASLPYEHKMGFGISSVILGYTGMILAFSFPIFLGIRQYRNTIGEGSITYWKALNIGILIVVISAIFYVVSWLIIFYWVTPDFTDKYCAFLTEQMKIANKSQKDIDAALSQVKQIFNNPFINAAYVFTEPLLPGIIITLICAAILRKKPASTPEMKDLTQTP